MNNNELFKIQSNTLNPRIGDILLSEPFMNDYYFRRSAILIIDHNDEGSLGVIINKRLSIPFNEIVQGFPKFDADVYLGGPVETDRLFFIHTIGEMIPDSTKIISGLYWSGNVNALKAMIKNDLIKPHEVRFFVGYAGWDGGQLRNELKTNTWIAGHFSTKQILQTIPGKMWSDFTKEMGKRYSLWSKFPINPSDN
ncbi:MAG: YqgE/AlgH family protein [Bacteroidales bacterium]|nr:YqgE/AlgH family protein [Bacteroidales bacterium]